MKIFLTSALLCLVLCESAHAQEVAILDQGYNTTLTNRGVFYNPVCFGIEKWRTHTGTHVNGDYGTSGLVSIRDGNHVGMSSVSLCKPSHFGLPDGAANTPRLRSLPDFGKAQSGAADTYKEFVTLGSDHQPRVHFNFPFKNISFGGNLKHGTAVANAAYEFNSNVRRKMFQIFYISNRNNSRNTVAACSQPATNTMTQNSAVIGGPDTILSALQRIRDNPDGVDAVNLSVVFRRTFCDRLAGNINLNVCDNSVGQDEIYDLEQLGIPVVVGLGNEDIGPNEKTWPACLDGVIKVGSENDNNNVQNGGIGIGAMDVDFYAKNTISVNNSAPGNSLAAPRIATAYAMIKEAVPNSTIDQRTEALRLANTRTNTYRSNGKPYKRRYVKKTDIAKAITELEKLIRGNIDNIFFEDLNEYGPIFADAAQNYSFEIDFNNLIATNKLQAEGGLGVASKALSVSSVRDVVLSLDAKMSASLASRNGLKIYINNTLRESTDFFNNDSHVSLVLNRNFFSTGSNTIRIEPANASRPWGIKNIRADFAPPVELVLEQMDTAEYGYSHTPARYTGLRAKFNLTTIPSDFIFSATGWDIDTADESSVFLNGELLGTMNNGPSSQYSPRSSFRLRKADLKTGSNVIEFVQRTPDSTWNGFENEKWAVKDLLVQQAKPDLTVSSIDILDRNLDGSQPFQATATISNIGIGSSIVDSVVRFYVSTDKNITRNDTQIASTGFAVLNENRSRVVIQSIQTSLVNQGYYLGACIDAVPTESISANNCSEGIALKSAVSITPIIMLLLDNESS